MVRAIGPGANWTGSLQADSDHAVRWPQTGGAILMSTFRLAIATLLSGLALSIPLALPASAQAPQGGTAGVLTCRLAPSIGLLIGSRQRMSCRYVPNAGGPPEFYNGVMNNIGLDIGITAGGVLAWGVVAPTSGPLRGALAGTYVGASGSVGLGVGVGANVLVGGSNRTISLQPLSVEGSVGINLSLGVSGLTLTYVPR